MTDIERREIAQRYQNGDVVLTLCADYRRGKATIKAVLAAAGITMRPAGYAKGTKMWSPGWRAAHKAGTQTPENRERARRALLQRLASMRGPATNTAIEQRLHDALSQAGIGFTTQSLLLDRHLVDIELHQARVVIEADGAQHALRDRKAKDVVRDAELVAAGYRVFRFTGSEINRDAADCVRRVAGACGLTPDIEPIYNVRIRFAGPAHPNWKGGPVEYACTQCGQAYLRQPSHRKGARQFCRAACYHEWLRGKPRPERNARSR